MQITRAVAVAALVAVVAACGGGVATVDKRALTVLLADDWATAPAVVAAVKDFERSHPDVRVELRGQPFAQVEEAIVNDLAGPRDVDVAQFHAFASAARGLAEPLDEHFRAAYPDGTFVPGAVEDVTWRGRIYGVPLDVNAMVLLVNTTLLRQLGHSLEDLATFEGLLEVAESTLDAPQKLTAVASSSWASYGWIRANGGEVIEVSEDSVEITLDAPAVVESMRLLATLTKDERYAFRPYYNDVSVDGFALFRDGQAVLWPTGSWDVAGLDRDPPEWEFDVVPMPRGPSGERRGDTVLGGSSLYVPVGADDVDLSFDFVQHLTAPEYLLEYARQEGRLPPRVDVLDDPFFDDPRYATVVDALPQARPMRLIVSPAASDAFANAIAETLNNRLDAADALRHAQELADRGREAELDVP